MQRIWKTRAVAAAVSMAVFAPGLGEAAEPKDIVKQAMEETFVKKDVSQVDKFFGPYKQHNLTVPDGVEGLKGLIAAIAGNPNFKVMPVRMFADGNYVVSHSTFYGFGPSPLVAFDIFRIEGDKIVEHWDSLAPQVAPNPSGHTETDGPVEPTDRDKTAQNKALVAEFYNTVLIGGKFDLLTKYIDGENYTQHNPNAADGLSGLSKAIEAMAKQGIKMEFAKVHLVLGDGSFVLVQAEGALGGKPVAYYDLFRVANNKIVEHWDVIQPIPTGDMVKNQNSMF